MLARTSYLCNKRLVSFLQAIQARSGGTHTIHTAPHRIHRSLTETHKAHTGSHTSVICLLVACNDLDIQTKKDFFSFVTIHTGTYTGRALGYLGIRLATHTHGQGLGWIGSRAYHRVAWLFPYSLPNQRLPFLCHYSRSLLYQLLSLWCQWYLSLIHIWRCRRRG